MKVVIKYMQKISGPNDLNSKYSSAQHVLNPIILNNCEKFLFCFINELFYIHSIAETCVPIIFRNQEEIDLNN